MILKWSSYLANHDDRHKLEQAKDKVINLFKDTNNDAEKTVRLHLLSQHPTIPILTLDPFDKQVTISFFHETQNPTLTVDTPTSIIALTGLGPQAIPIHIQTENLFNTSTTPVSLPTIPALMNTHNAHIDQLKQVTPTATNSHTIYKSVPLTPNLALPILIENISSPWMILHSIISSIATLRPNDTEPYDWTVTIPYTNMIYTLWAFCNTDKIGNNEICIARRAATDTEKHTQHTHQTTTI